MLALVLVLVLYGRGTQGVPATAQERRRRVGSAARSRNFLSLPRLRASVARAALKTCCTCSARLGPTVTHSAANTALSWLSSMRGLSSRPAKLDSCVDPSR